MDSENSVTSSVEPTQESQPLESEATEGPIVKITPNTEISGEDEPATPKKIICDIVCTEKEADSREQDLKYNGSETSAPNANINSQLPITPTASSELLQMNEDSRSSVQSVTSSRSHDPVLKQGTM